MKQIETEIIKVDSRNLIALYFAYDEQVVGLIRPLQGAFWSPERKCWLIKESNGPLENLNVKFKGQLLFTPREPAPAEDRPPPPPPGLTTRCHQNTLKYCY